MLEFIILAFIFTNLLPTLLFRAIAEELYCKGSETRWITERYLKMGLKVIIFGLCMLISDIQAWGFKSDNPGKVLLRDVQVLTLRNGQMTTGRRSSPVPQLNCIGGSAKGQFTPQVVQCYNRGWDGQDVQWECKSDMDNLYRFGSVEVLCEGYDHPDDPYILKGSCGLEYTLELTKEGQEKSHNYYGNSDSYSSSYSSYNSDYKKSSSGGLADLVVFAAVCLVLYALYKTCIDTPQTMGDRQYSSTGSDYPGGHPGGAGGWSSPNNNPGGPGNGGYDRGYDDGSCGAGAGARHRGTGGGGGFWSGMATGGLLGYMFGGGTRNRGYG